MINLTQEQLDKANLTERQLDDLCMDFDMLEFYEGQRAFSLEAYGPDTRTLGVKDHILKELDEVADAPDDLEEWVDLLLLSGDGVWRQCAAADNTMEPGNFLALRGQEPFEEVVAAYELMQSLVGAVDPTLVLDAIRTRLECITETSRPLSNAMAFASCWQYALIGALFMGNGNDGDIIRVLLYKMEKNKNRKWPDWRGMPTDKAIEHTRTEMS